MKFHLFYSQGHFKPWRKKVSSKDRNIQSMTLNSSDLACSKVEFLKERSIKWNLISLPARCSPNFCHSRKRVTVFIYKADNHLIKKKPDYHVYRKDGQVVQAKLFKIISCCSVLNNILPFPMHFSLPQHIFPIFFLTQVDCDLWRVCWNDV